MSTAQVVMADVVDSSGICPREPVEYMARQVGGYENLWFTH